MLKMAVHSNLYLLIFLFSFAVGITDCKAQVSYDKLTPPQKLDRHSRRWNKDLLFREKEAAAKRRNDNFEMPPRDAFPKTTFREDAEYMQFSQRKIMEALKNNPSGLLSKFESNTQAIAGASGSIVFGERFARKKALAFAQELRLKKSVALKAMRGGKQLSRSQFMDSMRKVNDTIFTLAIVTEAFNQIGALPDTDRLGQEIVDPFRFPSMRSNLARQEWSDSLIQKSLIDEDALRIVDNDLDLAIERFETKINDIQPHSDPKQNESNSSDSKPLHADHIGMPVDDGAPIIPEADTSNRGWIYSVIFLLVAGILFLFWSNQKARIHR